MSDTLIVGIMSVIATVILAPIVVKLLNMLSEKRSQLFVVLTWNAAGKSKTLEERATNLITNNPAFREVRDDSKWDEVRLFRAFFSSRSYLNFKVVNNSRKKLAHLTMYDNDYSDLYQIDEGDVREVTKGQPIVLGDLQPGREVELHLWSSTKVPIWNPDTKKRFKFSADELDRIKFKEPMPEFLKQRYKESMFKYLFFCMCMIWIVGGTLAIFQQLEHLLGWK